MSETNSHSWRYLDRKPGSFYRQLFVKDRNIAARTLYSAFVREEDRRTPDQIAEDYDLPIEAVREAIAYCESNPPELTLDWEAEQALQKAAGMKDPEYPRTGRTRRLPLDKMARLGRP